LAARKFGLNNGTAAMSTLGHKRTYAVRNGMSALPPEADIPQRGVSQITLAWSAWA